jgi:DTW domain-containing protein YfiP
LSVVKRPTCATCLRPQSNCICAWVTPIASSVEVLILQHPLEVHEAKGTARLLQMSLPNSRLITGEVFDGSLFDSSKHSIFLYPETPPDPSLGLVEPPVLDSYWLAKPAQLRLVVIDGTWRKSRKMLYLNPALQQMPRLALQDLPTLEERRYSIRKAHKADQLSTLEATCAALAQLEGDLAKFEPLLAAFDGFVAQLQGYIQAHNVA